MLETSPDDIAIIGMVGRFPEADNLEEFWQLLRDGREAITFFTEAELQASGMPPTIFNGPRYVKAGQIIKRAEWFDAAFFGFTPREAEIIDPQQRMFLECAWAALEDAGYNPERYAGQIGIYAGATSSNYLLNLYTNQEIVRAMGYFQITLATEKDHLPMRVSYKLNLKGPSINVQTACSTSLVAVHLACEGLLNRQCDMALAGAVTLRMPQETGYEYEPGGVASADGHCAPFAAEATGTVFGNGIGIVVLKRLEDALTDRDHISAVIKSSAINNDGALKIGYTAPSVEGQVAVITEALALANIAPETISYIEAHGTGTPLGDPIEIAALTQVFRTSIDKKGFCALGAVKANVGHLETASGMAGLIKTALMLKHKEFPPQVNFAAPNPAIDFAQSPFYINTSLKSWPRDTTPRRAGVSSFGMGGTNAHVVLEEAPQVSLPGTSRSHQLLVLSARSAAALQTARENLADYLRVHPETSIANIAFTLQMGRRAFPYRQILVCTDGEDAVHAFTEGHSDRLLKSLVSEERRPLAFLFPGQGSQYVNMARDLYQTESLFRGLVDYCTRFLQPLLGLDLCSILYPDPGQEETAKRQLGRTALTQPTLFVIEYALARLWLSWGLQPQAFIGHSIGEYVAACLAGVFSLEDALILVAARGRLVQQLPAGAMLSLPLSVEEVTPYLDKHISLAAINAPKQTVVAGTLEAVAALEKRLEAHGLGYRRLRTSHAFHSEMMEPALQEFRAYLQRVRFHAPEIPYLSNVTGTWVTEQEAQTPAYWMRHLRQTVLFAAGIETLITNNSSVLLEVGPGQTLGTLALSQEKAAKALTVIASLRHPGETRSDVSVLLTALGKLWLSDIEIDWHAFSAHEQRRRVSLPTYPFERQPYYIKLLTNNVSDHSRQHAPSVYTLSWKRGSPLRLSARQQMAAEKRSWIIFSDQGELSATIIRKLTMLKHRVTIIEKGQTFTRREEHIYTLNPANPADYQALRDVIAADNDQLLGMIFFWDESFSMPLASVGQMAVSLSQVIPIWIIGTNNLRVESADAASLAGYQVLHDCIHLAQQSGLLCRYLDIAPAQNRIASDDLLLEELMSQMLCQPSPGVIALRGHYCWEYTLVPIDPLAQSNKHSGHIAGSYLIHNISQPTVFALANYLTQFPETRLVLLVDADLPSESQWHDTYGETQAIIQKIQRLQEKKKDILLVRKPAESPEALALAIAEVIRHEGELDGIIFSPGHIVSAERADQQTFVSASSHLQAYARVLSAAPVDFCLFCPMAGEQSLMISLLVEDLVFQSAGSSQLRWLSLRWDDQADEEASASQSELLQALFAQILRADQRALQGPLIVSPERFLSTLFDCRFGQRDAATNIKGSQNPVSALQHASRANMHVDLVPPRTATEQALASIWRHLLGIDQVSVFDNFFDLGGHSLLATQVIVHVRETFKIDMTIQGIFDAPTIAAFSLLLDEKDTKQIKTTQPAIQQEKRPVIIPASFSQRRLWFFDQLEASNTVYNIPVAVRLKGSLHQTVLEQALDKIVLRHEVLRTTFALLANQVAQVIQNPFHLAIAQIDISSVANESFDARVKELVLAESHRPFDLGKGPLLRAKLLKRSPQDHILILTFHHIIFDAWSLGIFLREVATLYEAFDQGQSSPLQELPFQYADMAIWQQRYLQGAVMQKVVAYWTEQLAGSQPYLDLPHDRPRPALQTFRGSIKSFTVPEDITAQLVALSRKEGVTLFSCLLAAFNTLLFSYTGQADINVGTAVANRPSVELEKLIGFFVDTLVLRTRFNANAPFRELIKNVHTVVKEAQEHGSIPFEYLVEATKVERNPAYNPLFQTAFVMQNTPMPRLKLSTLTLEPLQFEIGTGSARFDLLLDVGEVEKCLAGLFEYNIDLFDDTTILRMIDLFQLLLTTIVANPECSLLELAEFLTRAAKEQQRSREAEVKQDRRKQLQHIRRQSIVLDE